MDRSATMRWRRLVAGLFVLVAAAAALPAGAIPIPGRPCDGSGEPLLGAGSTLQDAIHQRLFIQHFERVCPRATGTIRHLRLGEDFGLRKMQEHDIEYVLITADRPLSSVEFTTAMNDLPERRGRFSFIAHIPLFITPVAITYTPPCPGLPRLRLTSRALSLIMAGLVPRWDSSVITDENPAYGGCSTAIKLATRVDTAATTRAVKDYIVNRNPYWTPYNLTQTQNTWPTLAIQNCQGYGDEGVATCVAKSAGFIGYVTQATLKQFPRLQTAAVENGNAQFVTPSISSCRAAASDAYNRLVIPRDPTSNAWSNVSLADAPVGYPICNISYAIQYIYLSTGYFGLLTPGQMRSLVDYLRVAVLSDAVQPRIAQRGFAPLPPEILAISRDGAARLEFF